MIEREGLEKFLPGLKHAAPSCADLLGLQTRLGGIFNIPHGQGGTAFDIAPGATAPTAPDTLLTNDQFQSQYRADVGWGGDGGGTCWC